MAVELNFVFEQYGPYFAVLGSQGDRAEMEDAYSSFSSLPGVDHPNLFLVLDGHGGKQCAIYAKDALPQVLCRHPDLTKGDPKRALREAFLEVDGQYCKLAKRQQSLEDGTTVSLLYCAPVLEPDVDPEQKKTKAKTKKKRLKFWLASCGDSRAVLVKKDGSVIPLSHDHDLKRDDEAERILRSGGRIKRDDFGARVVSDAIGELAVTRAIGDLDFKQVGVTAEPEIYEGFLDDSCAYIIMASDGLWNQLSNEECASLLTKDARFPAGTKLATMIEELIKTAKTRDNEISMRFREDLSCDNITVLGVNVPSMIDKICRKSQMVLNHQRKKQTVKKKKTLRIRGLSPHGYTAELLLWKNPLRSLLWLVAGCLFYFLAEVAGYSVVSLISYLLLAQLMVDSIVVNFTPLLRRMKLVGKDFDSTVFLNQGRFITEEVVDRAGELVETQWRDGSGKWETVVYDASPNNVLLAMRNISYCFTPFTLSTLAFIAFLSSFSLFVTYVRNKDLLDRMYNSILTRYYKAAHRLGFREL